MGRLPLQQSQRRGRGSVAHWMEKLLEIITHTASFFRIAPSEARKTLDLGLLFERNGGCFHFKVYLIAT